MPRPSPVPFPPFAAAAVLVSLVLPTGTATGEPAIEISQPDPGNCWIWGAASLDGDPLPQAELYRQLRDGPHPTVFDQGLGEPDGWSLTAWAADAPEPSIQRDPDPVALDDEDFDREVDELVEGAPALALAHFRNTSSGCTPEEGNPHPFLRQIDGGPWILQHNGTVSRTWLQSLIGPGYLADHPPHTCPDDPVDSELILIFLGHRVEHRCDDTSVEDALYEAFTELAADHGGSGANLLISEGSRFWALRLARSDDPTRLPLHLREDATACWVDKKPPNGEVDWLPLDDLTAVQCDMAEGTVDVTPLAPIFDLTVDLDDDGRWCEAGGGVDPGQTLALRLRYLDPRSEQGPERAVTLGLPGASPVRDVVPSPTALSTDGGWTWNAATTGGLVGNDRVTHLRWDLRDDQERLVVTALVEASCTSALAGFEAHWGDEEGPGGSAAVSLVCADVADVDAPVYNANPAPGGCQCNAGTAGRSTIGALLLLVVAAGVRRLTPA